MIEDSKQFNIVVSGKQLKELIRVENKMAQVDIMLEYGQVKEALPIVLDTAKLLNGLFECIESKVDQPL